jgi:pimeloyl-ACP methyl ester carboxylesterase
MNRGALVGLSFGGWIGSMVAAVDARIKAATLTATHPRMSEFWRSSTHPDVVNIRRNLPPGEMDRYAEALNELNAVEFLPRTSNVRLFFQFGADDELISEQQVRDFSRYASGKNRLKIYESASHFGMFLNADGRHDRLHWIEGWSQGA